MRWPSFSKPVIGYVMDELTHIRRIMTTQPDSGLANRRPETQAVVRRTAKTPGRPKTGARRGHHEIFINGRHRLPSGSSIAGTHTDWESRVRRQSGRLGVHLPSVANDRFWDSLTRILDAPRMDHRHSRLQRNGESTKETLHPCERFDFSARYISNHGDRSQV